MNGPQLIGLLALTAGATVLLVLVADAVLRAVRARRRARHVRCVVVELVADTRQYLESLARVGRNVTALAPKTSGSEVAPAGDVRDASAAGSERDQPRGRSLRPGAAPGGAS